MSIYKACDIRGDAERELSPALYWQWGRRLGERLEPGARFVVGGDVRVSTPAFLAALTQGLAESGLQVVDLGILPTPMVYFGGRHLQAQGCAIVTASHNPPSINGLKWMVDKQPPDESEAQSLAEPFQGREGQGVGPVTRQDIAPDYQAWLTSTWGADAPQVDLRILLDPGNGCWAGRSLPYLQRIFPQAHFQAIHDRPDGRFPDRNPDCAQPQHLQALAQAVINTRADVGLAFDGDGDRVAFVDEEGVALTAEETTWILLHSFREEWRGQRFVYDLKFSDRIPEAAAALGAQALPERSGHAFIRRRMLASDALFGAEISGHFFYRALEAGDDGLYTACRMIVHLAHSRASLSRLRRRCPPIFMTPDLRLPVPVEEQEVVINEVRQAFAEMPQSFVDGVRVDFPDGWALVRRSVTESVLTFRFEGANPESLKRMVQRFCGRLERTGERLWELYQQERKEP